MVTTTEKTTTKASNKQGCDDDGDYNDDEREEHCKTMEETVRLVLSSGSKIENWRNEK